MNKLIKIELERAFKNKMLIISVVIGLVLLDLIYGTRLFLQEKH